MTTRVGLAGMIVVAALAAEARAADPVVSTDAGAVRGIATDSGLMWLGIPYAVPPTGDLRWRRTIRPLSWADWPGRVDENGVLAADARGPACLQPWDDGETYGSEDCLYLNVTAPPGAAAASRLPVFVHIHGGANFWGEGEDETSAFVRHGVIVVTMNYRLGMMGLLAHTALSAEGGGASSNYHLWDIITALEWVRDNIAAFGGDPENVTLGGFSAGAGNALALLASPFAEGLFRRAAIHAVGNPWVTGFFHDLATREFIGSAIAARVGCGSGHPDVAACLRSLPAERLVLEYGGDDWGPTIEGMLVPRPTIEQIAENGGTVPLLIGHNREEMAGWLHQDLPDPLSWHDYVLWSNDLVPARLGSKARPLYPASDYDSLRWAFMTMASDAVHGCATRRVARATRNTTYRYLNTHVYENYWWAPLVRAAHGVEYELLWYGDFLDLSEDERDLSARMTRYWTNYMKTGDPNGEGLEPWPTYDPVDEQLLVLDTPISVLQGGFHVEQCAVLDQSPPFPSCNTALCRQFIHRVLRLPGWHPKKGWFLDETSPPPRY